MEEGVGAPPKLGVEGAVPHQLVVLRVPAGVGRVDRVHHGCLAGAHEDLSAGGTDGGGGSWVFSRRARVDLTVLMGAQQERICEMARADLGDQLSTGGDGLGGKGLRRGGGVDLGGDEPGEDVGLSDLIAKDKSDLQQFLAVKCEMSLQNLDGLHRAEAGALCL